MKQRSSEVLKVTFGLLFSVIISDKRIFTDSRKTLVEDFAQYLAEYASKVPKTCTNRGKCLKTWRSDCLIHS